MRLKVVENVLKVLVRSAGWDTRWLTKFKMGLTQLSVKLIHVRSEIVPFVILVEYVFNAMGNFHSSIILVLTYAVLQVVGNASLVAQGAINAWMAAVGI